MPCLAAERLRDIQLTEPAGCRYKRWVFNAPHSNDQETGPACNSAVESSVCAWYVSVINCKGLCNGGVEGKAVIL